ncbi:MAG: lipase family protein [Nostocoides sp.]
MSEDPSVQVSGGAHGLSVALEEMGDAAAYLRLLGPRLMYECGYLAVIGVHPALLEAQAVAQAKGVLSGHPAQGARILQQVLAIGGSGARCSGIAEAASLGYLSLQLAGVVALYRVANKVAEEAVETLRDATMEALSHVAPLLLLGAGGAAVVAEVTGADLAGGLDEMLYDQPWLTDVAVGGSDGFIRGLAEADPRGGLVLAAAAVRAGVPFPPQDAQDATAILAEVGQAMGGLEDGIPDQARTEVVSTTLAPGPAGLADLATTEVELGRGPGAEVRIVQVPQSDGSSAWIVQLPGTQRWGVKAGDNPFDLTTDVVAMTGAATVAAVGTRRALETAMARAGRTGGSDPVMLVGHSEGGILAASLAADPTFRERHSVRAVVTFGAPVASFEIPRTVSVLSVEHTQDPVPRLDGAENPDAPNWTTAKIDLGDRLDRATASHDSARYAESAETLDTLIAEGSQPSLTEFSTAASPFLDGAGPATVTDVRLERTLPHPPPADPPAPIPLGEADTLALRERQQLLRAWQ